MGTKPSGIWPTDSDPSWMDETLPLELRHKLLDTVLDGIKTKKRGSPNHPGNQDSPGGEHPGETGSETSDHSG